MRNFWDHFALVLYLGGIILFCLTAAYLKPANRKMPEMTLLPSAVTDPLPAEVSDTVPGTDHQPKRNVSHIYGLDASGAEPVSREAGMLKAGDIAGSRYYSEPSGAYEHVYREENGVYDRFACGTGPVGNLDAWAKYVFRYDSRTGKAVSFVQEQHIGTGEDLDGSLLPAYAANTGSLLEAVFSGTDIQLSADKRKIEELALYFFGSYIPSHPSVPALLHFRMPAYILTFVMDTDVFITMISPGRLPSEYVVENETD